MYSKCFSLLVSYVFALVSSFMSAVTSALNSTSAVPCSRGGRSEAQHNAPWQGLACQINAELSKANVMHNESHALTLC